MVSIIDYSLEDGDEKGVSVGKIEDTGSFSTKDKLLESILNRYVENGVKTYIPDHSDIGIKYNVGVVECGQKGFAKAVIQHLPSPYYGKKEEIKQLSDYEVKDIQTDKNNSPLRGKQGMNTVNRFTSLASQSPPVTRERVDAEWNDVEDEENLPESSKTNKNNRQYIDSPEEAPDDANVEEGEEPGVYYYIPGGGSDDQDQSSSGYGSNNMPSLDISVATSRSDMQDNQDWAMHQLRDKHGDQVDTLKSQMDTWKTDGYATSSFLAMWNTVGNITGNDSVPKDLERYENSDAVFSGSEEYESMVRDMIDMNQESIRESYGEEITVYRGFAGDVTNEAFKQTDEGYEVDPLALESWTMDKEVGEKFQSFAGGGVLVKKTMSPEDFAIATQIMEPSTGDYFEELTAMRDGPYTISSEEIIDGEENITKQDNHRKLTAEESDWINTLRQSEKSKNIVIKQIELNKEQRNYVESPDEAPEGVEVQEGDQGGLYWVEDGDGSGESDGRDKEAFANDIEIDPDVSEDEIRSNFNKIVGNASGPALGLAVTNALSEHILSADSDLLKDIASEFVDWQDRDFERASKEIIHQHTQFEDSQGSYQRPSTRDEAKQNGAEFKISEGADRFRTVRTAGDDWVSGTDMFSEDSYPLWQVAASESGNSRVFRGDEEDILDYDSVSDEDRRAVNRFMQFDQSNIREKFGDEITVYRGLEPSKTDWEGDTEDESREDIQNAVEAVENGENISMEHSCAESWATNPMTAYAFAGENGIIIEDTISPEDVLMSSVSGQWFVPDQGEMIRMHYGDADYENGEDVFFGGDLDPLMLAQRLISERGDMDKQDDGTEEIETTVTIRGESNQNGWISSLFLEDSDFEQEEKSVQAIQFKQDIPQEYRQYVDSENEAPGDVQTYEGNSGGIYYDTRDVQTANRENIDGYNELRESLEEEDYRTAAENVVNNQVNPDVSLQELKSKEDVLMTGEHLLWASDIGYLDGLDEVTTLSEEEAVEEFGSKQTVARISHNMQTDTKRMLLSPLVYDQHDIERQHEAGHLSTDNEAHYLQHEIGHLAHDYQEENSNESVDRDAWMDVLNNEYLDEIYTMEMVIESGVSNYAATSPRDFVAEVWVGLINGEEYSEEIMGLYRKRLGPGVQQ